MENKNISLYFDIFFCVVLVPVMTMLLPVERWINSHSLFLCFLVLWLYGVYFLHRKLTMPLLFRKKNIAAVAGLFVATIVVTYIFSKYHEWSGPHGLFPGPAGRPQGRGLPKIRLHEQGVWFLFFIVTVFSVAVGLLTELYNQTVEKREIENEKNKAELALYKAQINPHFLFNTMNTLYGLMLTKSEKAENAFIQFMDMMKYMYTNGDRDFIPLSEEIDYLRKYIDLQKNRLNEHTEVRFSVSGQAPDGLRIAPMLLITFVENAFKYGVSSHVDTSIDIMMEIREGNLMFAVRNDIVPGRKNQGDGIGLKNCRKRLELIYSGKHSLTIVESVSEYRAELSLNLN